jgi:hypothetical protein
MVTKAAEAITNCDNRLLKMEADLNLLKWMVGSNIALTIGVLFKLFTP